MRKLLVALSLCAVLQAAIGSSTAQGSSTSGLTELRQAAVYISGEGGYDTYRIPALVVTNEGTLLAFSEGRRLSRSDTGDIDLLLKRSEDGGETWSQQQVVWNDSRNVCGNPAPVVDRATGTIWLLLTWNRGDDHERQIIEGTSSDTRRVFVTSSIDDGRRWSQPKEITASVKRADWTWYATGPGAGIQLQVGGHAGRLLIPCDHIERDTKRYYSHVIYSDDHGATWRLGRSSPGDQVNECQVAELEDGRLLLNMRNYDRTKTCRQVAFSGDGGLTWTGQRFEEALAEPICQASVRRAGDLLFFSNPSDAAERVNMTVQVSDDEGFSWRVLHRLYAGPSAYSDLALLPNDVVGCLYERGSDSPYEEIALARFPVPGFGDRFVPRPGGTGSKESRQTRIPGLPLGGGEHRRVCRLGGRGDLPFEPCPVARRAHLGGSGDSCEYCAQPWPTRKRRPVGHDEASIERRANRSHACADAHKGNDGPSLAGRPEDRGGSGH